MPALDNQTIEAVWTAYVDAVEQAGPLPDRIEDMPAHTIKHYASCAAIVRG